MVLALGQGHSDAHPCILQICTVASLSSPLRGSRNVFTIDLRQNGVSVKKQPQSVHQTCLSLMLLLLLLLLLVAGCWLLVVGCWLLVVGCAASS